MKHSVQTVACISDITILPVHVHVHGVYVHVHGVHVPTHHACNNVHDVMSLPQM